MNYLFSLFDSWPFIVKLNLILSILFFSLAIWLIGSVYYIRYTKTIMNIKRRELEKTLLDFISSYLFDENFDKSSELTKLKKTHINTEFNLKITIKQLLIFNENLKGASTEILKELFMFLGLYEYVVSDLKSRAWEKKARALHVFSQLYIKAPEEVISPLINDQRLEVRQQAVLYILNLSETNPLEFLNTLQDELTLWQQIYMEHSLKNSFKGEIPNFSQWTSHPMSSVVRFSIRMMSEFNQFQNIPILMTLIDHNEESVRKAAIHSLSKMGHIDLIPKLISKFKNETPVIKKEILKTINHIGSYNHLLALEVKEITENKSLYTYYSSLEQYFKSTLSIKLNMGDLTVKEAS
ncbi:hypothetical protein MWU59_07195 [Flavobacteriaceae bacterium F08102]|nr:hypothetical protein [Flavobacteriaceae bacterium F08102]